MKATMFIGFCYFILVLMLVALSIIPAVIHHDRAFNDYYELGEIKDGRLEQRF